jgi:peptidoglycan/LPS O-acetylase OafA/YrhL
VDAPFFHAAYISSAYWSLVAEVRFYVWICVFACLFRRRFEIAWGTFCLAGYAMAWYLPPALSNIVGGEYLPFFTLGIAFYKIYDGAFNGKVAALLAIALLGVGLFWSTPNHDCDPVFMLAIIAACVGLFILFLRGRLTVLATGPLLLLGRISYPLYLLHFEIAVSLMYWLRLHRFSPAMSTGLATAAVGLLAYAVSATVEVRGRRLVLAWMSGFRSRGLVPIWR